MIPTKAFTNRFLTNKKTVAGGALLSLVVIFAFLGPYLSSYGPNAVNLIEKNTAPCLLHIFGTDDLGRDIWIRACYGIRLSLGIGCLAAILDLILGITWGAISGYMGGKVDLVMMRILDLVYGIPHLLAVILVSALIGSGVYSILIGMCFISWIQMARVVRTEIQTLRKREFVIAAEVLGVPSKRIILFHILPNISGTVIAMLLLTIPHAIFAEAMLSFLGIGIPPPQASLGSMIADGIAAMRYYPWRLFIPAGIITVTTFAFHLLGDGLRDILDPQHKELKLQCK